MKIDFHFATHDDCLDKMVPSDLRQLVRERDDQAAHVEFLTSAFKEVLDKVDDDSKHYYLNIINSAPAQSHKAIQAKALRDVAYKLTFTPVIHDRFYKGYDHAISDVRAAADALEGESDDRP
jgi:hypothetical protein